MRSVRLSYRIHCTVDGKGEGQISVTLWQCAQLLYHSLFTIISWSVAEILKKHEKEFFRVVDAKVGLRTLIRTGVITEDVKKEIDDSNKTDAREILYDHLKSHANVDSLLEFCEVAIAAEGLPNMQAFGEKLKKELSPGGWYSWVLVCVCVCVCVLYYPITTSTANWPCGWECYRRSVRSS